MPAEVNPTVLSNLVPAGTAPKATGKPPAAAPPTPQVDTGNQKFGGDRVSLSARGLRASGPDRTGPEPGNPVAPKKTVRDVTDDHRLVVKFVDPESDEVVRQVPSEDLLRLKRAMSEIVEENREDG